MISINLIFSEDLLSKSKVFENVLINQLKADFFWRDPYKNEVDMILDDGKIIPVEVKYGEIKDIKSLLKFMNLFDINKGFVISREQEKRQISDGKEISIIPAWKWLLEN